MAPLLLGSTTSLLAFPMEEAPAEINQNSIFSQRAGTRAGAGEVRVPETREAASTAGEDATVQIDIARAPEGSAVPPENSGLGSSAASTFNVINIRENQNSSSDPLRTAAAAAGRVGTPPEGSFNAHDIRAIAPHIDNMTQVIGVPPQLVRQWVFAGLSNDTITQDATLHQIVQIIANRTASPMTDQALADLKNDLFNRTLEAQGRPSLTDNEEPPSTKLAGNDPRRELGNSSSSTISAASEINDPLILDKAAWRDVPPKPTSTIGLLDALQESRSAHLVPEFLISDVAKEKEEYQQKYTEALNDLRALSPELAKAMMQEELPKTEEEAQAFKTKYERLVQDSTSGDAESLERFNEHVTQAYGLKAALNVLDVAEQHKKRFLTALQELKGPEAIIAARQDTPTSQMNRFYHEHIESIDKTVQNLQRTAASILQMTESINTNVARWSVDFGSFQANDRDRLYRKFNTAMGHANNSILLNTQYAEAIRAGNPQAARALAQVAQTHARQAELLYSGINDTMRSHNGLPLSIQWWSAANASFRAAEETGTGNYPRADLYAQAAAYYRKASEADASNNNLLAKQLWQVATMYWSTANSAVRNLPFADLSE